MEVLNRDPGPRRDDRPSGYDGPPCALHLTPEDARRIRALLAEHETLLSVARFHTALVVMSHAMKWLAGIVGAAAVLKGLDIW